MSVPSLPVAIIGAGPVGLAAAAHVVSRSLTPVVFEAGRNVGDGVRRWGHVRVFSPWSLNVDPLAADLLTRRGWTMPPGDEFPTGRDLVERYLEPLAALPEIAPHLRLRTRVLTVARQHHDRMKDGRRQEAPFLLRLLGPDGERDLLASAVIDASGTIDTPGPLGASGVPRDRRGCRSRPHLLRHSRRARRRSGPLRRPPRARRRQRPLGAQRAARSRAARCRGACHSHHVGDPPARRLAHLLGGPREDQLEERGKLGSSVRELLDGRRVELATNFHLTEVAITRTGSRRRATATAVCPR